MTSDGPISTNGIASPWFDKSEYEARLRRVQRSLADRALDGLVVFQPESVTWLTGFFTRGYASFQCALVPADGTPAVICRDVEKYYLDSTCVFADHTLWRDEDDSIEIASRAIARRFDASARLGIELSAWPLSAGRYENLRARLPEISWADNSRLLSTMRLIKSEAEIAYQRQAGKAAEAGMQAAIDGAGAGASERARSQRKSA
ncbi:MAG: aminopeptidase P family N-terminal domain-containing protein, partial [Gemmatimonadetes bacterium]|nr:aminopeptidase P family N-terminal domain-containing protein [Gemmatimonadota bacterium]